MDFKKITGVDPIYKTSKIVYYTSIIGEIDSLNKLPNKIRRSNKFFALLQKVTQKENMGGLIYW